VNLLRSLERQTHSDFRILLVDQNPPGFLDDILAEFQSKTNPLEIVHLRSQPGLSRARNIGLANVKGDAFAIMDDDLIYENDTLSNANNALKQCDIVIGKMISLHDEYPKKIKFLKKRRLKYLHEAFYSAPSATLFFRKEVGERLLPEGFNESIGAGTNSPYGSGAETDFLVRAMKINFCVMRHPEVIVRHPKIDTTDPSIFPKARRYGRGRNFIIRQHNLGGWFIAANAIQAAAHIFQRPFNFSAVRYHWQVLLGRLGI
jgi:glycosyltransferase involved in cell wall biosynthesis